MSRDKYEEYKRPFPGVIRIEPAGACNLSCSHCPTGTIKMTRGVLRPDTFKHILESLRHNLNAIRVVVLYHGGEPLLNKNFPEMTRQVKALGVPFVKTVSNGMLLTEQTAVEMVESGLDAIEFSLDGESPEQNNMIRRNCDYDTVVANVKNLIAYKRSIGSDTPEIFISTTQFIAKQNSNASEKEPAIPEFLIREFSGTHSNDIAGFKSTYAMRWPHMEVLEDIYDLYYDPTDTEVKNHCDHVDNTITIRWNGDDVGCCYDLTSRYVLGNILENDLATIWNSTPYLKLRKSIHDMDFVPMCANCNTVKPNVYLTLKSKTESPDFSDGPQTGDCDGILEEPQAARQF